MPNDRYKINRSNYTIRTRTQRTSKGDVYERDFMTTTTPGSWVGDVFTYSEGNFKMATRVFDDYFRSRTYGEWITNEDVTSAGTKSDVWTISNTPTAFTETTENRIVIKPNFSDISNFAYYGGMVQLLKNTILDIAKRFPAEIYVTDQELEYYSEDEEETVMMGHDIVDTINTLGLFTEIDTDEISDHLVLLSNPFAIDISSNSPNIPNAYDYNSLRFMCESSRKYNIVDSEGFSSCICDWNVVYRNKGCYDGDLMAIVVLNSNFTGNTDGGKKQGKQFVVFEYYYQDRVVLLTSDRYSGFSIRPIDKYIKEYYETIDDFTRVLLNNETTPLYTCRLDYPRETDIGTITSFVTFTWPTSYGGYNPDISSERYTEYIGRLLPLCQYYDDRYSNNIWNRMTHDAIKNMDSSGEPDRDLHSKEDYEFGTGRIEDMMQIWGTFFDWLKRKIDNVKYSSNVTYSGDDNLPDYFISDALENDGWEVSSSVNGLNPSTVKIGNKIWDAGMTNVQFMRNLKLSSQSIFSRKGTKDGMEAILGMFGLKSYEFARNYLNRAPEIYEYDYKIDEYVYVASSGESVGINEELNTEKFNRLKYNYVEGDSDVQGLPCVVVERGDIRYIVPWYTNVREMDGNPYFEMYGGWGKLQSKKVYTNGVLDENNVIYSENSDYEITGEAKSIDYPPISFEIGDIVLKNGEEDYNAIIYEFENGDYVWNNLMYSVDDDIIFKCNGYAYKLTLDNENKYRWNLIPNFGFGIYDESLKYIKIVKNVGKLKDMTMQMLDNNDIVYVYELSDYDQYYDIVPGYEPSHYFYLADKNYSDIYGTGGTDEVGEGWINVSEYDIRHAKNQGVRVLYLESIIDDYTGNAPHVGMGNYDDGNEYLKYFKQIFYATINSNNFNSDIYTCETNDVPDEIKDIGFNIIKYRDNMKCWYFTDDDSSKSIYNNTLRQTDKTNSVGADASVSGQTHYESDLIPHNFEGEWQQKDEPTWNEGAVNSIINTKKMIITFDGKYTCGQDFKDYFIKSINPYLKQMIPSTTIYEVKFATDNAVFTKVNYAKANELTDNKTMRAYAFTEQD